MDCSYKFFSSTVYKNKLSIELLRFKYIQLLFTKAPLKNTSCYRRFSCNRRGVEDRSFY